ncbi:MFS transporter [Actinacidiphila rubida]|uniref:Predicted arabinose efflux permease, MFS family n=1 Tax=Actinacidiphila rubida TaxID=310780 RepID=A0A1H8E537_9ACTN|nr:MFS transporter [Actinacidiphila rubida]SEN14573.1 Predicted arabinose efflux permease, MFS family [Actinacidiphila rubida]
MALPLRSGPRAVDPPAARGAGSLTPLLAAAGVSVTGDGAFLVAAPLLAASLTRDPFAVSTVTAAFYLPWLIAGLPAGALADRWPRRRVMLAADLVRVCLIGLLAALVLTGHAGLPVLLSVILLTGVAGCFFDASSQAVIPTLAGRDKDVLAKVNGRYWSIDTVGRSLLGPSSGSLSFAAGRAFPFVGDAFSFAVSALCISRLPSMPAAGTKQPLVSAIREGLAHLRRTRQLRELAATMAAYNFSYNVAMATFVLYATGPLHIADSGYGILLALGALGGIATGWRAARITRDLSHRQTMTLATGLQAIAWLGIATVRAPIAIAVFLGVIGGASTLMSVAASSARAALTPDHLLGRVVSAFRLFGIGAAGLGALAGGLTAQQTGLRTPLWAAVALLALTVAAHRPWRRATPVPAPAPALGTRRAPAAQ